MSIARTLPGQYFGYCRELISDREAYDAVLGELTNEAGFARILKAQSLAGVSAMGLLTKQAYDMAVDGEAYSPENRWEAAKIGGMIMLAADVVDDEIDRREMPVDEKFRYLDAWAESLKTGENTLTAADYPAGGDSTAVRGSFDLARYIHDITDKYDGIEGLVDVMSPLIQDVKDQIVSRDETEQLELTVKVGAGCGAIGVRAVEIVEQTDFPVVMEAAEALGGYAECLNHAYEISEDVEEGSLSYATLYLGNHGDTPENRKLVKSNLIEIGDATLEHGIRQLNKRQRRVMSVGKGLIDLKYRVLGSLAKPSFPQEKATRDYATT